MKLHQDAAGALNTVTAYDTGYVEINANRHDGAVYFLPEGPVQTWLVSAVSTLEPGHVATLLEQGPEIVLLGTGSKQVFPKPHQLEPLIRAGCGYEVMNTPAACRTYNILMSEGRLVMAALMPI
jgi:uncharacterized protein